MTREPVVLYPVRPHKYLASHAVCFTGVMCGACEDRHARALAQLRELLGISDEAAEATGMARKAERQEAHNRKEAR